MQNKLKFIRPRELESKPRRLFNVAVAFIPLVLLIISVAVFQESIRGCRNLTSGISYEIRNQWVYIYSLLKTVIKGDS